MTEYEEENPEAAGVQREPSPAAALSDILRAFLVRCGNDVSRGHLSHRLAAEGLTAPRLSLICETMEGRGKPEAETAAYIGQVLKTKEGWEQFLGDLEFAAKRRSTRPRKGKRGPTNQAPLDEAERVQDSQIAYIVERVSVDGKTPEDVAAQFQNMTPEDVRTIVQGAAGR